MNQLRKPSNAKSDVGLVTSLGSVLIGIMIQSLPVSSPAELFSEFWTCRNDAKVEITSLMESVILNSEGKRQRSNSKPLHEIV